MNDYPVYCDKIRVEIQFPKKDFYGSVAGIWIHISVIRYFKTLSREMINVIQESLVVRGKNFFGDLVSDLDCGLLVDNQYGLRSWNCPGNACGYDISHDEWKHSQSEDTEWISYLPHNVDNSAQLNFLLASACWFCRLAEVKPNLQTLRP